MPASARLHIKFEIETFGEDLNSEEVSTSAAGIKIKRRFGRITGYFLGREKPLKNMLLIFFYYADPGVCNFKLHVWR